MKCSIIAESSWSSRGAKVDDDDGERREACVSLCSASTATTDKNVDCMYSHRAAFYCSRQTLQSAAMGIIISILELRTTSSEAHLKHAHHGQNRLSVKAYSSSTLQGPAVPYRHRPAVSCFAHFAFMRLPFRIHCAEMRLYLVYKESELQLACWYSALPYTSHTQTNSFCAIPPIYISSLDRALMDQPTADDAPCFLTHSRPGMTMEYITTQQDSPA